MDKPLLSGKVASVMMRSDVPAQAYRVRLVSCACQDGSHSNHAALVCGERVGLASGDLIAFCRPCAEQNATAGS